MRKLLHHRWTDSEIAELKALHGQAIAVAKLARRLGRAQSSIRAKMYDLHLPAYGQRASLPTPDRSAAADG